MHEIFGLKHVLSTFQETVWSHLKAEQRKAIKEFELLSGKDVFIKVVEALRQNIRPLR